MEGSLRTGNPSKLALLMEKKTSEASLSLWQGVVAMRRSRNSSRILSRYQDGGECRDNPSTPYHLANSLLPTGCILEGEQEDRKVVEGYPSFVVDVSGNLFASWQARRG